jgi:serine/threonine-protein kinase
MSATETPTLPIQPGDLVADKYRIERVLAQGGMGVVVVAHHEQLDQRVAIKLLLPEASGASSAVARFLREAQSAARIKSEHVCRVFDVGTLPDGAPYMVMELLDGADLATELEKRGALPPDEAAAHVFQALDAIVEAHRRGIVHRDLKPANLFLCRRDDGPVRVKVLDFGISKIDSATLADPGFKITTTQTLLGSPAYMSPEQVRSSRDVDARTDIWSLGVILYESIAGGMLFAGRTLGEVFSKIREDPIPPLSSVRPGVPAEIEAIVARCLQRKPDDRFATAAELREALRAFLGRDRAALVPASDAAARPPLTGDPALARTGLAGSAGESIPQAHGAEPSQTTVAAWTRPGVQRARGRAWAIGAVVLLLGGAGAWALLARDKGAAALHAPDPPRPAAVATDPPPPPMTVAPAETATAPGGAAAPESPSAAPVSPSAAPTTSVTAPLPRTAVPSRSAAPRVPGGKRPGGGGLDDVLGSQH